MEELEDIMLSKVSQTKTNTTWYHLHIKSKKTKNKQKIPLKLIYSDSGRVVARASGAWKIGKGQLKCKLSITKWIMSEDQYKQGSPDGSEVKNPPANSGDTGSGRFPRRRKWQPTPVFLPWESHRQRSPVGYSPWSGKRVGHNLGTKQQQSIPT